jgi:putative ABC transport system substrate-binding protein
MGRYRVRGTALLVVLTVLILPLVAAAQQAAPVRRIAFLWFGPPPSAAAPNPLVEAFRHALQARGWTEGHNLAIEWRWAEEGLDQFATLVAEVIGLSVEVLVVPNGTYGTDAAMRPNKSTICPTQCL